MARFKLTVEYDGTPYCGWQRQDGQPSVQAALEAALQKFTQTDVTVFAAGRTDTGVHGLGQVVHIDLDDKWTWQEVFKAANACLRMADEPVAIVAAELVPPEFDARFSAIKRHYRYVIINRPQQLTVERNMAWWVSRHLDETAMHKAAQLLVGHHDFTTFRSAHCQSKSPVKTLDSLDVRREENRVIIEASARSFLHNQIRSFVGSLKLVGDGKWQAGDLKAALEARDRKACGPVAPPQGLYLVQVDYPETGERPSQS